MICYIDFILYFFGFSLLLSVDFLQSCFVSTYVFCTIIVKHIICIYISPTKQQYNTIYRYFFFLLKSRKKNWAAALSFVIICIIAFTGIFCFIIWIWITVWYHLLLAGRISFIFLVRKVYYQCVLLILVYQECLYFVFILKR